MANWQDRITGFERVAPDQLRANPMNWRKHPASQQAALTGILNEVGWADAVKVSTKTGNIVDGHLRVELALRNGDPTVPVLYLDVDDAEEKKLLATFDPIGAMAETDAEILDALLREVNTGEVAIQEMLAVLATDAGMYGGNESGGFNGVGHQEKTENYSRKIEPPVYEPTGDKPLLSDLFDSTRADALISEIDSINNIPEDVKEFLRLAAYRHVVFNFKNIANFYAHSGTELQSLMENNALVIIDFDKAIELGFVELTKEIAEMAREDGY